MSQPPQHSHSQSQQQQPPDQQLPPPPVPFSEFTFSLNDQPYMTQSLPPLPFDQPFTATALFSQTEETSLLGFLDNFDWDMGPGSMQLPPTPTATVPSLPPTSTTTLMSGPGPEQSLPGPSEPQHPAQSDQSHDEDHSPTEGSSGSGSHRSKPLLTLPQKRMNHILSEQKRRNAIRDGYAQLSNLIAPDGKVGKVPTRGRPRGSGRGRGRGKGKSGVLFRAVEYCNWLDDSIEALEAEVQRVEQFAGIQPPVSQSI